MYWLNVVAFDKKKRFKVDSVEVAIMSDTIKTKEDYNFTPFQIEFTW